MNTYTLTRLTRVITTGQHKGQWDLVVLNRTTSDHTGRAYVNNTQQVLFTPWNNESVHCSCFPYMGEQPFIKKSETTVTITEEDFYKLHNPMMYGDVRKPQMLAYFD